LVILTIVGLITFFNSVKTEEGKVTAVNTDIKYKSQVGRAMSTSNQKDHQADKIQMHEKYKDHAF